MLTYVVEYITNEEKRKIENYRRIFLVKYPQKVVSAIRKYANPKGYEPIVQKKRNCLTHFSHKIPFAKRNFIKREVTTQTNTNLKFDNTTFTNTLGRSVRVKLYPLPPPQKKLVVFGDSDFYFIILENENGH